MKPQSFVYYDLGDVIKFLVNDHGFDQTTVHDKLWEDFEVDCGSVFSIQFDNFPEFSPTLSELANNGENFIRVRKYW